jgi:hypothetical protein
MEVQNIVGFTHLQLAMPPACWMATVQLGGSNISPHAPSREARPYYYTYLIYLCYPLKRFCPFMPTPIWQVPSWRRPRELRSDVLISLSKRIFPGARRYAYHSLPPTKPSLPTHLLWINRMNHLTRKSLLRVLNKPGHFL